MLGNIKIKGFKSIRQMDLELKGINILIGANGVGKSNFISFFKLLNNIYEQRLERYSLKSGIDNLLHYGQKETASIEAQLSFGAEHTYQINLLASEDGSLFIGRESVEAPGIAGVFGDLQYDENLKESRIKYLLKECAEDSLFMGGKMDKFIESYKIYHFHDTSGTAPLRSAANINDNKSLKEDGANLPAYLYYLQEKHPKTYLRIEKLIQSLVPSFERFSLAPSRLQEEKILLEWSELGHPDSYFNAKHLSDGSLRFIALVTLLMQPKLPKVIIIDEPELGLHPTAIVKLAALIKSAAARGCQMIISTQSVSLLNHFEPEDIITVDREQGQSVFRRLDSKDLSRWLEDYSIGDLWSKSIIKAQPL